MRLRVCGPRKRAGFRLWAALAATVCIAGFGTAQTFAGNLPAQPEGLSVTAPAAGLLPQTQTQGTENGWLAGLHVSGYASQTFGMWQNPTTLRDFTPSRNNLAVARTLLQVDENYRLNENNTFFMREWFVYEPPYSFDSANNKAYSAASVGPASFGHFMNDWYNDYEVRDAWWENKTGPLTTFIGNQIVVWGQSIAFRVGDVVNPVDTSWAFGFSNLEQSRKPQWMIHPILNLPELGPLSSNFLELVVQPGFQPQWWSNNYADGRYSGTGYDLKEGRQNTGFPSAMHGPSARFDVHYDNQAWFGQNAPLSLGPYGPGGAGLVAAPFAKEFMACSQLAPLVRRGFNTVPASMRRPCALGLSKAGDSPYGPTGAGAPVNLGVYRIPGMQPRNWNEGGRFHTLIGATEYTFLYYNDNTSRGTPGGEAAPTWTPYTNLWNFNDYDIQEMGMTADRPLPMPESLAEYFPAVFRGEALYTNHMPVTDMQPTNLSGQRFTDMVTWMAAVDLDQAYAPWLTSTGNLSANVEVYDNIFMDLNKTDTVGADVSAPLEKNQISILLNVGTSWWWEDFAPAWTMIYAPKGNTFLLFPSIVLNPPWTKKYFMKLQAIEVLGGDRESPEGGLFKGESLLTAQFQYNFNLL